MFFFDTHSHVTCDLLWERRKSILPFAELAGVKRLLAVCTEKKELERGLLLQASNPKAYFLAASTGPNEVEMQEELFFPLVEKASQAGFLHAIGETGLDFYWNKSCEKSQREAFIRYLELALASSLPVVLHCRQAFRPLLEILDRHYVGKRGCRGGVLHCFSEGIEEFLEISRRGFFVSFSGVVTYKKAFSVQEAARQGSIGSIVLETDSPYLGMGKKRSGINEPAEIVHVAEKIASLREISLEELATLTYANSCRLFQLTV